MCDKRDGCLIRFSLILIAVAPIASLKMGSTLNPKDIKEGSDVYFECNVRANPRSYKLTWFHEVGAASTVSFFFFFPFFFFLFFSNRDQQLCILVVNWTFYDEREKRIFNNRFDAMRSA